MMQFTPEQIQQAKKCLSEAEAMKAKVPAMILGYGKTNIWLKLGDFIRGLLVSSYERDILKAYKILGFRVVRLNDKYRISVKNLSTGSLVVSYITVGSPESFLKLRELLGINE
jgi:hypothetical protein